MGKSIRAFGIALFLAGATLYINDYFNEDVTTVAPAMSSDDIAALEEQIQTLEQTVTSLTAENEALTAAAAQATSAPATSANEQAATEETADVVSATLYVYEGMSIYDIGKQAEDLGLVKVGRELELFLSRREYSRSIQKGAFDLQSSMTYEQMAYILTGKTID